MTGRLERHAKRGAVDATLEVAVCALKMLLLLLQLMAVYALREMVQMHMPASAHTATYTPPCAWKRRQGA